MTGRLCSITLVVTLEMACASPPRAHSFAELPKHLNQGNTIYVTDTTGTTSGGQLGTLSTTSLKLLIGADSRDVWAHDVTRITRQESRTGRGALIGLALGFGVGLIAARSRESSGSPIVDTQAGAGDLLVGMGLGTAVGAIVGARVKVNRTIYEPPIAPPNRP